MELRPTGVTVLSVLHYIGAGFMLLGALAMMAGLGTAGALMTGRGHAGGMFLAGLGAGLAVVLGIFAALIAILAWGLWTLKNWARVLTIIFAALGVLGAAGLLMMGMTHINFGLMVVAFVRAAISGIIIWYLLQPHVKAAFGTSAS